MDLQREIREFLYEQGQLTEECPVGDSCRHIVDHPIWTPAGYVSQFTCYNAEAFVAGLAHHLEQRYRQDEEMARALAMSQHRVTQAFLASPEGREAFRRNLAEGIAILRGDVRIEHFAEGDRVRVFGPSGAVIYDGWVQGVQPGLTPGELNVTLEPEQPAP